MNFAIILSDDRGIELEVRLLRPVAASVIPILS